jgi:hypothetical protein
MVHGFSVIRVGYTALMADNGQNFAGLSTNSLFYNISTAVAILAGRFGVAIPAWPWALFSQPTRRSVTHGALPTDTTLFARLMIATALVIGALGSIPLEGARTDHQAPRPRVAVSGSLGQRPRDLVGQDRRLPKRQGRWIHRMLGSWPTARC